MTLGSCAFSFFICFGERPFPRERNLLGSLYGRAHGPFIPVLAVRYDGITEIRDIVSPSLAGSSGLGWLCLPCLGLLYPSVLLGPVGWFPIAGCFFPGESLSCA